MVKRKTCIFISGKGSNLKNLIYHSRDKNFPIQISLVISDNKEANGVNYAKKYKIPYIFINTKNKSYENKILLNLRKYNISFICLAGYMKIVSNKIINIFKKNSIIPDLRGGDVVILDTRVIHKSVQNYSSICRFTAQFRYGFINEAKILN